MPALMRPFDFSPPCGTTPPRHKHAAPGPRTLQAECLGLPGARGEGPGITWHSKLALPPRTRYFRMPVTGPEVVLYGIRK